MTHVRKEMSGRTFGRYLVLSYDSNDRDGRARWLCRCECGTERVVLGKNLRSGVTKSCGCYARELLIERSRKMTRPRPLSLEDMCRD